MNKIYRIVWNAARTTWVAAPETTTSRGKGGSLRTAGCPSRISRVDAVPLMPRYALIPLAVIAAMLNVAHAQTVTIGNSTVPVALQSTGAAGSTTFDAPQTTVINSSGDGITANASQNWTLSNEGSITGQTAGIRMGAATVNGATIDNFGSIVNSGGGSGGANAGIVLQNGGTVTNHAGASISSQSDGIYTDTAGTTVTNDGAIATNVTGVYFGNGGTFTQSATGSIHDNGGPTTYGVIANGGTLNGTNAGSIEAATTGVWYWGGSGTFTNTGSVTAKVGVELDSASNAFFNSGTITGSGGNAIAITGNNNALTLNTGSVLNGNAVSTGTGNTLALLGVGTEASNMTGFSSLTMGGNNWQLAGTVSTNGGSAAATKVANGQLTITGTLTNSNGGGITIDAPGFLQIGNGSTTGSIVGNVVDNGTLAFNRSDAVTYAGVISGSGAVRQMGPGTLTLTGANAYGSTTVAGGSLAVDAGSTTSTTNIFVGGDNGTAGTGTLIVENGGKLNVHGSFILGQLSGSAGTVNVDGIATRVQNGAAGQGSSYTVNNQLIVGGAGTGTLNVTNGARFSNYGDLVFARDTASASTVTVSGAGSYLSASNSVLKVGDNGAATLNVNNGGFVQISETIAIGNGASSTGTVNVDGAGSKLDSYQNSLTVGASGNGTLNISNGASVSVGETSLKQTVIARDAGSTGAINIGGAVGATAVAAGTLNTSKVVFGQGTGSLNFNHTNTNYVFSSAISGAGSVNQVGPGTTTLAGANAYSGGTNVNAGTLAVNPTSTTSTTNLGTGTVAIAANATLAATTNGAFNFDNALTGTGTLSASNSGVAFSFTSNAGSAFAGTAALSNNTFALGGNNTTALTNATLSVGTGSVTTVVDGNQQIGGLVFNGGTVVFNGSAPEQAVASSLITANTLDVSGTGVVRINVPAPYAVPAPTPAGDLSLFAQSHINDGLQLVAASSVTGSGGGLTLQDQNGNAISAVQNINIQQGGNLVAVGQYNYMLGTGAQNNGLYVGYGLSQLDLQPGQTLTLTENAGATGNDADLAAKLTGTGNLQVAANSLVSLSNATNDFSGTTTVSSGTLQAGAANVIASSSAVTLDDGTTFDTNGYSQSVNHLNSVGHTSRVLLSGGDSLTLNSGASPNTFAGVISGDGSLVNASGDQVLTGGNTYTGGTTIAAGTLQLGDGGTSGSVAGDVVDNGTLAINHSNSVTLDGRISGTGALNQIGSGTTVLTADETYTGGTTITAGTLQLGNGGTSGSVVGDVIDNGTLAINHANSVTLDGLISGTGALNQIGSGTTVLTAGETYTGGTTITAGTLQLGNGGTSGSVVGGVVDNGTLAINHSNDIRFAGAISGSGVVNQIGSGTTTLAGVNTYSGGTNINAGTLAVDVASTTSTTNLGRGTVAIAAGATLAANTNGAFNFDNVLTGTGTLSASNTGGAFSFTANAGSAFAGTVALSNNTFALGGVSTATLTHATLNVGAGNTTTVADGNQHIGGLVFNGGTVVFNGGAPEQTVATSLITANTLDVSGTGVVRINVPAPYAVPTPTPAGDLSLFAQSHVNDGLQLVAATAVTGNASGLTLQDKSGNAIAAAKNIDIQQGGNVVAVGQYNYMLGTGAKNDGLYVGYGLSQLDLQPGQTLTLTGNGGGTDNGDTDMAAKLTGNGNLEIGGTGNVTVSNPGNDFHGTTTVSSGSSLQAGGGNSLSQNSLITVEKGSALDIGGYDQTVPGINNGGTVTFGEGTKPGTTLTVKGDYVGTNGQLVINTVYDKDNSATDKLVIDGGHASGHTDVVIKHAGGNGAQTDQGIRVIETRNGATTDAGAFNLSAASDGYRAGVGTVAMGAYDYSFKRGGNGGAANDWYLTSVGNNCTTNASLCPVDPADPSQPQSPSQQPVLRPEVGAYLNNRWFAQTMQIHTLHDRQNEAPSQVDKDADADAWVRVVGKTSSREDAFKMEDTSYLLHLGSDVLRFDDGSDGSLRFGAMGSYGESNNSADNGNLTARGKVRGYSAGVYGTWYGHKDILSGPYVDSWIMYGAFNNRVNGQGLASESYHSSNLAASLEAGYAFALPSSADGKTQGFIEPQAQVIASDYRADTHTEHNGTVVSGQSGTAVTTRLGVRVYANMLDANGVRQLSPFVVLNWWHGPGSQSATFDGVAVRDGLPQDRAEVEVGLQGNMTKAVSVWGGLGFEVGAQRYRAGEAKFAVKYSW